MAAIFMLVTSWCLAALLLLGVSMNTRDYCPRGWTRTFSLRDQDWGSRHCKHDQTGEVIAEPLVRK